MTAPVYRPERWNSGVVFSVPFVYASYEVGEVSQSPGGLPYRWILKGALPVGFVLLLLGVASRLSRVWSFLAGERA